MNEKWEKLDSLKRLRIDGIKNDLKESALTEVKLEDCNYSETYYLLELTFSYVKRAQNIVESMDILNDSGKLLPLVVLARSLIETVAMGAFCIDKLLAAIDCADYAKLEEQFFRFYAGTRNEANLFRAIHINDALRYLEKEDMFYLTSILSKHTPLTIDTIGGIEAVKNIIGITKIYGDLSEASHPNGVGTHMLFPFADGFKHEKLSLYFADLGNTAIWHCHHLLSAASRLNQLERKFSQSFPNAVGFNWKMRKDEKPR